jgi:hypothetical protein
VVADLFATARWGRFARHTSERPFNPDLVLIRIDSSSPRKELFWGRVHPKGNSAYGEVGRGEFTNKSPLPLWIRSLSL